MLQIQMQLEYALEKYGVILIKVLSKSPRHMEQQYWAYLNTELKPLEKKYNSVTAIIITSVVFVVIHLK